MSWKGLFVMIAAGLCFYGEPNAFGSVGGTIGFGVIVCWTGGTLYTNRTASLMNFDLNLANLEGSSGCSITASWTDSGGRAQTITLSPRLSTVLATSLGAHGVILWSSGGGDGLDFQWQLEQAPAVSIAGQIPNLPCGSTETLYTNLTRVSINFHLAVFNGPECGPLVLSSISSAAHA
jgi:hypothetical protein